MKYIIIIFLIFIGFVTTCCAQGNKKNVVSGYVGAGYSVNGILGSSFEINYNRHLLSGLYARVSFAKFSSGGDKSDLQTDSIFSHYIVTAGEVLVIKSYGLGLSKSINLGPKVLFTGALSISSSIIKHQYIGFNTDHNLIPIYEDYQTLGAKINIGIQYFVAEHVSFDFHLNYNSSPQLIALNAGANTWF